MLHSVQQTPGKYHHDLWRHQFWIKENRYYRCDVQQDLFGEWLCIRSWGGLKTRGGQQKTTLCDSYIAALRVMAQVEKRRKQRGYQIA